MDKDEWVCALCTFSNKPASQACDMCGQAKPVPGLWTCTACTFAENDADAAECTMCGTARAAAEPASADDHAAETGVPAFGKG